MICCRYNISTGDYEAWNEDRADGSLRRMNARVYNGDQNGNTVNRQISNISDVYAKFGMDYEEARLVSGWG